MKARLVELKLLKIRQDLKDQMDQVLRLQPVCLAAYKTIREDYQYCSFLLRLSRKEQTIRKLG